MIRRLTAAAAPVVLLAGVVAAVLADDSPSAGRAQARLDVLEGAAVVSSAAGLDRVVTDEEAVDFGDTVTVRDGAAVLELADGATFELRHHDGISSSVLVGATPRVAGGQVLAASGFPATVAVGSTTLSARGALKIDAEEEIAASYQGGAGVSGVGSVAELLALRQLVLVPGASPQPLAFDGTDPWDRRFLGEAIAFGERLEALARGYTSDLPPGGGRSADFFRAVLPALADEPEFSDDLLDPGRAPGETLVGATIAVQGRAGTFRERWEAVFAFRDAGAAWGLVALERGVSSAPVLEAIELAVSSPEPPATPVPSPSPTSSTTTTTAAPPSGAVPPATPAPAPTEPPPEPAPEPAPAPEPEPEPGGGGLLGPTVAPVVDLVGTLLEGLLGGG